MIKKQQRPKYLNLLKINLPVTGVASIAHRISGALLAVVTPFFLYCFALSLHSAEGFTTITALIEHWLSKLVFLLLIWALAHHLFAGIRYLLIDLDLGVSLQAARASAWVVNFAGLMVLVVVAVMVLS